MELISAKIAARGEISKPTRIVALLNDLILDRIRFNEEVCSVFWYELGLNESDDEAIGYVLEILIDADYDVAFFYEDERGFSPSGIVISWGHSAKLFHDWFEAHPEFYRGE